ncbi:hypothetical protein SAY87_026505 [Trapa incisa]|uniref:FRIGIDA-like protein n=1 Tax=Trapa incisa TaxID=236973 RepID=A0AAN7GQF3_9MYRT|nr:hypothetical protein SAY87_026505 [Trapa incisa]
MEDAESVSRLMDSTSSKILQLQKAFAELENQRAVTLNLKWKELEEHFHGLERSLKRRFHELEDQEKVFKTKVLKAREMLEEREAAVVAKEQASLDRLQKKRDAAVLDISTSLKKHRKAASSDTSDWKVQNGAPIVQEQITDDVTAPESCVEDPEDSYEDDTEVNSSSLLDKFFQDMDSEGLHKFISDNRKDLATIRQEIPRALRVAPNPASFVLQSLADFYSTDRPKFDGKKDSDLLGLRRTSIMLMECLSILLTDNHLNISEIITHDIKLQAKGIAEEWKPKLDALDTCSCSGNSLEAHAFLQLLATFRIALDYEEEFISQLIPMVSRRRQAADLCCSLGFSAKMPGIIQDLVNSGRHIDAVNLAFAFELTEQFNPVHLLKSYLGAAKKAASPIKPGNPPSNALPEVNDRELAALKATLKCIEEHKLEVLYPVDPIRKHILELEKIKAEKKKLSETTKPQPKRLLNTAATGYPMPSSASEKQFYPRVNERLPSYMYDRPYIYHESHGPPLVGPPVPYSLPPGHGNFFGNVYHYQTSPYLQ